MHTANITGAEIDFGHVGWRYYNIVKKKAMEREFSWSGLVVSLSVAFFIVIASSFFLSVMHNSVTHTQLPWLAQAEEESRAQLIEADNRNYLDPYLQVFYINDKEIRRIEVPDIV